ATGVAGRTRGGGPVPREGARADHLLPPAPPCLPAQQERRVVEDADRPPALALRAPPGPARPDRRVAEAQADRRAAVDDAGAVRRVAARAGRARGALPRERARAPHPRGDGG